MSGDEHYFDGGIYDEQEETRTDIYLVENGPGIDPLSLDMHIVTGNADICIVESRPETIVRLGRWMVEVGEEMEAKRQADLRERK